MGNNNSNAQPTVGTEIMPIQQLINSCESLRIFLCGWVCGANKDLCKDIYAEMQAIDSTLKTPEVISDLKHVEEFIDNGLQYNDPNEYVHLKDALGRLVENAVLSDINNKNFIVLIEQCNMVQNVSLDLKTCLTIENYVFLCRELMKENKFQNYGYVGCYIGCTLLMELGSFLENLSPEDPNLVTMHEPFIVTTARRTEILSELRLKYQRARAILERRVQILNDDPEYEFTSQQKHVFEVCAQVVNVLWAKGDTDILNDRLKTFSKECLGIIYQPVLTAEKPSWRTLLDYSKAMEYLEIKEKLKTIIQQKESDEFEVSQKGYYTTLNYNQIRRLIGAKKADAEMERYINQLDKEGGEKIYTQLMSHKVICNYQENFEFAVLTAVFLTTDNYIRNEQQMATTDAFLENYPLSEGVRELKESYDNTIEVEKWLNGLNLNIHAMDSVIAVMRTTALLQMCAAYAPWLSFPMNAHHETINGLIDVPKGVYNIFRHPIETVKGFGEMGTADFWNNYFTQWKEHPLRMSVSVAGGVGAGAALGAMTGAMSASFGKAATVTGRTINTMHQTSAVPVASAGASASASAGVGAATQTGIALGGATATGGHLTKVSDANGKPGLDTENVSTNEEEINEDDIDELENMLSASMEEMNLKWSTIGERNVDVQAIPDASLDFLGLTAKKANSVASSDESLRPVADEWQLVEGKKNHKKKNETEKHRTTSK